MDWNAGTLLLATAVCWVVGYFITWTPRAPGGTPPPESEALGDLHCGWMAGGARGLVVTAFASLWERNAVVFHGGAIQATPSAASIASGPVEKAILAALPYRSDLTEAGLLGKVSSRFRPEIARLEAWGLWIPEGRRGPWWLISQIPMALLFVLVSMPGAEGRIHRGDSYVAWVTVMVVGFVASLFLFAGGGTQRTRRGDRWLHQRRKRMRSAGRRLSLTEEVASTGAATWTLRQVLPPLTPSSD